MEARRGGSKSGIGRRGFGQSEKRGKEVVGIQNNREGRVGIAQQTLAILDSGSFTSPTGIDVDISEELAQCCSQVQKSLPIQIQITNFSQATFWAPEQLER